VSTSERQSTAPAAPHRRRRRAPLILAGGVVGLGLLIATMAMANPANLQLAKSPLIGKPAPPIAGSGINAGPQQLSRFAGRWVLVNFFASWCIPCREEMPQLNLFETKHASARDATVLAVEYDQGDLGAAPGFLRSYHAAFPAVNDPAADVDYGITGIPETYLIDPAGTVVAKYFGAITAAGIDGEIAKLEAGSPG
jgi:cytochrome c biogenesis protein CcmG/thiol:disulfide interchange protein DsbE